MDQGSKSGKCKSPHFVYNQNFAFGVFTKKNNSLAQLASFASCAFFVCKKTESEANLFFHLINELYNHLLS